MYRRLFLCFWKIVVFLSEISCGNLVVHLFNPENDLALAAGVMAYTPPHGAALLRDAGRLLPAWWADDGDYIIADSRFALRADALRHFADVRFVDTDYVGDAMVNCCCPWGWSFGAVDELKRAGVPRESMPDDAAINRMRWLSHRRSALVILSNLGIGGAKEAYTVDEVALYLQRCNGRAYMKSPWSCSGRGVVAVSSLSQGTIMSMAAGIIRRQGSVILEPALDRVADFAALFYAGGDGVRFARWSLFETSRDGNYTGNIVTSDNELERRLSSVVPIPCVEAAVARMERELTNLIGPDYCGPLGVDMMVTADGFHPCVEINLRRTMGFVAADINRRSGLSGVLFFNRERNCFSIRNEKTHDVVADVS